MSNTTQRLKSRGTSFLRQMKDIGTLAVSSFDDIKKSLAKATNQDPVPPKEKHVKKLIIATETNRELNMVEFAKAVCRVYRKSSDWLTASKGLQLLHRIVQDGSAEFCDAIVQNDPEKRFNMSKFKDRNTSEAMDQTPLVKQYCRYLEERLIMYRIYQLKSLLPDMTLDAYVTTGDITGWLDLTDSLLRASNELVECFEIVRAKKSVLGNGAAIGCFTLCLDDSFVLYKLLSVCATKILDEFYKISIVDAKRAIKVYEKYCENAKRLENMFEFSKSVPQIFLKAKPPSLKFKPESVIEPMREYVQSNGGSKKKLSMDEVPVTELSSILSKGEIELIKVSSEFDEAPNSGRSTRSSSVKQRKSSFLSSSSSEEKPKPSPAKTTTDLDDLLSFDAPPATNIPQSNNGFNQPSRQDAAINILSQFDQPMQTNNYGYGNNQMWNNNGNQYGGNMNQYGNQQQQYGNNWNNGNQYGNQQQYGNNPYGNTNPYQNNPYSNQNPYGNNPYGNNTYSSPQQPRPNNNNNNNNTNNNSNNPYF